MSGKDIRETLGFLAVVISLVFVGLEIRQNTAAVRGATYQAISDMASTGSLEAATSTDLPLLLAKVRGEEDPAFDDLLPEDRERLRLLYLYTVRRIENVWVQSGYVRARAFRDFWGVTRPGLSADFVAYFENRYPFLQN